MFRRNKGDRYWHFSPACSLWPDRNGSVHLSEDEYPENVCPNCQKIMLGRMLLLEAIAD